MRSKIFMATLRRLALISLALVLMLGLALPVHAAQTPFQRVTAEHNDATFTYELFLTDQNGMPVMNPRELSAGDTLNVEIRLDRNQFNEPNYDSYGIEFRLLTRGLTYNNDGATLRSGTQVNRAVYMDGDSVGFAWYDMAQIGEAFANPVLAGSWSYTVEDPSMVNITVPVALIYVTGDEEEHIPVGKAWLFLDLNGGQLVGKDVSGEYTSGTKITLPEAKFGDYIFEGWSDGVNLYPAGSEYTVSGIVTLTAQWAELVRDRYVKFILNGGEFVGDDPTGHYADGEIIIIPEAIRKDYVLTGWSDGVGTYAPGDEYVVYNTVNVTAQWEYAPADPDADVDATDKPGEGGGISPWGGILTALLAALIGWLWWLLLLWKRKTVKYSLITGDVSLDFKNGDEPVEVSVVLYDGEKEYHLNKSGTVEVKHRLKFIKNVSSIPVAAIEPGTYQGKLLIHEGNKIRVRKCRIKALDKELDEK